MESFWQDLRHATRALRNSAGFTLIAIITLGLGMAVNTTIFSVINGILLRPLPVPHAEQITVLAMQQAGTPGLQICLLFYKYTARISSFRMRSYRASRNCSF